MTTARSSAGIRLRTLSWVATGVAIAVALTVSTALMLLTSYIHQTTETLAATVESLRLARAAELQLEQLTRGPEPFQSGLNVTEEVLKPLVEASQLVATAQEADALREATRRVERYLRAAEDPATSPDTTLRLHRAALAATDAFVAINVAQSQAARARADRWDRLSTNIAIGANAFMIGAAVLFFAWLRRRAIRPLLGVARAMEDYGRGLREVRADETGPHELREIARRFNAMADAIAAHRAAQLAFLAGVAHDLKNPLTALQLAVDARRRAAAPIDARTGRTLDIVARQVGHLQRMVGDFLDIAQIQAGKHALKCERCDLRELVREAAELFEGDPKHPLSLGLPAEPVLARCDPLRIQQVLVNLISNAVKYSPAGGPVDIIVSPAGDELVIEVSDRGVGMTAAELQQIFEPFARAGLARDAAPGVGLGLHVVQSLVLRHGGTVEVDSEPGRGSTFRVHLPRAGPPTGP